MALHARAQQVRATCVAGVASKLTACTEAVAFAPSILHSQTRRCEAQGSGFRVPSADQRLS